MTTTRARRVTDHLREIQRRATRDFVPRNFCGLTYIHYSLGKYLVSRTHAHGLTFCSHWFGGSDEVAQIVRNIESYCTIPRFEPLRGPRIRQIVIEAFSGLHIIRLMYASAYRKLCQSYQTYSYDYRLQSRMSGRPRPSVACFEMRVAATSSRRAVSNRRQTACHQCTCRVVLVW